MSHDGIIYSGNRDSWDSDSFENQLASSIIGLLEPVGRWNVRHYAKEATEHDVHLIRKSGLFVPHPSRIALQRELDEPLSATYKGVICHAMNMESGPCLIEGAPELNGLYQQFSAIRREPALLNPYVKTGGGDLYSAIMLCAFDGRLSGLKMFFTSKGREIYPCVRRGLDFGGGDIIEEACTLANFKADSKHTWTITSTDSSIRVGMGCYHSEVKSLLYARSLPMTATGRKRPVLHLVSAHRRRMREGIDVDISQFLRGVKKVEMGGAVFEVEAPAVEIEKMDA